MSTWMRVAALVAVAAATTPVVPAFAEDVPPAVKALDTDDAGARAAAVDALRNSADGDVLVDTVLQDAEAFASLSPAAQVALLRLVAESEAGYVNSRLCKLVRDDSADPDVRRAALDALAVRGGIADVSAVRGALDAFPEAAAKALAGIGGRSATSALRKHAGFEVEAPGNHAGENVHPAVLAALVRLGDDSPLRGLVAGLGTEDAARREELGRLLNWAVARDLPAEREAWDAHLRRRSLVTQLSAEELETAQNATRELAAVLASKTSASLLPDLVEILGDAAWPTAARNGAALVLGLGGATEAKDALLHACRNQEEGSVRLYAAEALARVGDLSCAVTLADRLVHDEDRDRIKARRTSTGEYFPVDPAMASALLRFGCPGAVEPVLEVLAGNYRTRMGRDTLRTLREATGGPDFGYEADSTEADRKLAVAKARAWWAEGRESMGLVADPADPGWEVFRAQAAERIEKLGTFKFLHQLRAKKALIIVAEPALPQLIEALGTDDLHVRMGAAEVLRGARLRAAGPALAARLAEEENAAARSKLVWALEVCGRPDAAGGVPDPVRDAVRGALADSSLDVRIAAARALGIMGDRERDAKLIQDARGRPENGVVAFRAASAGALLALGDRSGMEDIVVELRSDDVARRADAAAALERAGANLCGYDPDAAEDAREAAIVKITAVPGEER